MLNQGLFSSEKQDWCTPQQFFDELDAEFHFVLDAAATHQNSKCKRCFTPEDDGLIQNWDVGGERYTATLLTEERSACGLRKRMRKLRRELLSSC